MLILCQNMDLEFKSLCSHLKIVEKIIKNCHRWVCTLPSSLCRLVWLDIYMSPTSKAGF